MNTRSSGLVWWIRSRPFWVLYVAMIIAFWIWYLMPDQYPTIKRLLP